MNTTKIEHFMHFCEHAWDLLLPSEQERYYNDTGIIGFIEDCMPILQVKPSDITLDDIDFIVKLINAQIEEAKIGKIYGSYSPEFDVTTIFEEFCDDNGEPYRLAVRGFYYGEPNDDDMKEFYKDYEAHW